MKETTQGFEISEARFQKYISKRMFKNFRSLGTNRPVSQEFCSYVTYLEKTITFHVQISQPKEPGVSATK